MSSSQQHSHSLEYLERLLEDYNRDPASVPESWRAYFEREIRETNGHGANGHLQGFRQGPSFKPAGLFRSGQAGGAVGTSSAAVLQHKVDEMIRTYRIRGHLAAHVNPLTDPPRLPELQLQAFGLGEADLEERVSTANLPGSNTRTVGQVYEQMRNTYCRSIGVEVMHIDDLSMRQWLFERLEVSENRARLSRDEQLRILKRLTSAVVFEEFIQKKYLGAKSFSLEGAESLIPLLDLAIERAAQQGIREIVLGMAHRGRLNVLCNILGKSPQKIFREFEDTDPEDYYGRGDVKYHLGHSSDWVAQNGRKVHLSLCFNPSHLEFINPVAMGRIRAKQERLVEAERSQGMAILVHGDAAFAGEGIIQETLNLSQLPGYTTRGTLHVIVNNQIGFTTSPRDARSSTYCTDAAKMLHIPIFHVNGEDPEAVAQVVHVAMEFREQFHRDVVIDMYCYRRRGHNEGDEPAFTQPLLYEEIRSRQQVRSHYLEHLLQLGEVTEKEADELLAGQEAELESALESARTGDEKSRVDAYGGVWLPYVGGRDADVPNVETGVSKKIQKRLLRKLCELPEGFQAHSRLKRFFDARLDMASGERPLDWSAAEALAFATLVTEGHGVRMTGQDSQRGTFSHRHAVLHDEKTNQEFMPLANLAADQAPIEIFNSPLSEAGVLGFEYGYSLDRPDRLVIWEAQFGDFVNVAQVVIDQFITSGEDKWHRLSGVTLLLPHGFEGQGPEHSSARLERWLSLAAEDNIQVANPTTPAQIFHLLRRQVLRPIRKPLVVMTPKSLLRHPEVVSPMGDLSSGTFQRVLADPSGVGPETVRRVILCSGKIYYELAARLAERLDEGGERDVAILRMEQIYPLPEADLRRLLSPYADGTDVVWVQEEPRNMGAWPFLRLTFGDRLFDRFELRGIYREASSSPATGSAHSHRIEQEELLSAAFSGL